jgi:hypothetical protein
VRRHYGSERYPKLKVNQPRLRDAVRRAGPIWLLARQTGFRHESKFSQLIHANVVKATHETIQQLYKIADRVGLDRDDLFLLNEPPSRPATSDHADAHQPADAAVPR